MCTTFAPFVLYVMLRSHLERDLAEYVELKICVSSESSPGFGSALCDGYIQVERLANIFRTEVGPSPSKLEQVVVNFGRCRPNALPICWIFGWPRVVNAISLAGHLRAPAECMFYGKVRVRWRLLVEPAQLGASWHNYQLF